MEHPPEAAHSPQLLNTVRRRNTSAESSSWVADTNFICDGVRNDVDSNGGKRRGSLGVKSFSFELIYTRRTPQEWQRLGQRISSALELQCPFSDVIQIPEYYLEEAFCGPFQENTSGIPEENAGTSSGEGGELPATSSLPATETGTILPMTVSSFYNETKVAAIGSGRGLFQSVAPTTGSQHPPSANILEPLLQEMTIDLTGVTSRDDDDDVIYLGTKP
jgi:hypothetical protein